MIVGRQDVEHVAKLARLEFSDEELEQLADELWGVLGYVEQLEAVDLEGVPPTTTVVEVSNGLRDDQPHESLPVEVALESAPDPRSGGFGVPSPAA